ncbi:MAG: hypothetical protein ACQGVK_19425 [Myxococcota bacterium]
MRQLRQLVLAIVLTPFLFSSALALDLVHGDLVALGTGDFGEGIYRVDSGSGAQELIASGSFSDVALRGAHRIYATRAGEVVEVDPRTGDTRVVASGFSGRLSVAVNPTGTVFVLEDEYGSAPRLHRVDPAAGTRQLILTSSLPSLADPGELGIADVLDLELLDESTPIALVQGRAFGGSSSGGVVAFDRWSGSEEILVSALDVSAVAGPTGLLGGSWSEPTGLGVTADGRVLVACDGDFDCGLWAYDPETGELDALGVEDVFGVGPYGSVDWNDVDITALPDGELFISTFNRRVETEGDPALSGIHRLAEDACPHCDPDSDVAAVLVDGEAFSRGSWTEVQAVDAQAPIPEPGAFLAFAIGGAVVAARMRSRPRAL